MILKDFLKVFDRDQFLSIKVKQFDNWFHAEFTVDRFLDTFPDDFLECEIESAYCPPAARLTVRLKEAVEEEVY